MKSNRLDEDEGKKREDEERKEQRAVTEKLTGQTVCERPSLMP